MFIPSLLASLPCNLSHFSLLLTYRSIGGMEGFMAETQKLDLWNKQAEPPNMKEWPCEIPDNDIFVVTP